MRTILFVITKSNWGGAQRYVFDLATSLPRDQFEVGVVCGGNGPLVQKLQETTTTIYRSAALERDVSIGKDTAGAVELYRLFKKVKPDIVHLNSSKAGGLGALAARLARVPHIVFTSHGLAFDEDRAAVSRALIWLATWATFLLAHKVITISSDNARRARRLPFCADKIVLVHHGIARLEFLPREEARAALGLSADALVIGALGELTWNKNYHSLIRTAGELKRQGHAFLLSIIGDGEEAAFLQTLADEHDVAEVVRFAGFMPQGYHYLLAFDLFVLPSLKEGLPYVLLEAGQAGLPTVASSVAGVTDILGDTGILVKPKDERALAKAIGTLLGDAAERQRLGPAFKKRVESLFSPERMLQETVKVYER